MNFNTKYNYKPYTGGAGGDQDHYNNILVVALTGEGVPYTHSYDDNVDPPLLQIHVGTRHASYDRWGYCSDDENETLDQADLDDTLRYLMQ